VIQGLPVLGSWRELRQLIRRHQVDEVLLTPASCPPEIVEEISSVCKRAGVPARKVSLVLD
jgi:FlaA1/EpsC-like NDP-sugar epimerase